MKFETALYVAAAAHLGQTDKLGDPYILHPLRVAARVHELKPCGDGAWEQAAAVALLHDVIEDTDTRIEDLTDGEDPLTRLQVAWLDALTHRPNEPRADYIRRVLSMPAAKTIKWCDIIDNVNRIDLIPHAETRTRLADKYSQDLRWLQQGFVD